MFHKFFGGSALRSIENLLSEKRYRAAWVLLNELNSPTAEDRTRAQSQQAQRLNALSYTSGSLHDHINTFEHYIDTYQRTGVAIGDRQKATYLADSITKGSFLPARCNISICRLSDLALFRK